MPGRAQVEHGRPADAVTGSTAQILRDLVDVLRTTDAGMVVLGEMLEQVPPTTERAQGDLEIIAAWLDEHPDVDSQIFSLVELG